MRKALVVSITLHIGVLAVLVTTHAPSETSDGMAANQHPGRSVQVKTMTEAEFQKKLSKALDQDDTRQQIVQGDDQLKSDAPPPPDSKEKVFLSKNNQVVDRNTRAAKIGKYKNLLNEGVKGDAAEPVAKELFKLAPNPKDLESQNALLSKTGRLRSPAAIPPNEPTATGGKAGDGSSATDDYLEDVVAGANTLLNTREFKFYGFYERVREKLSYQWHSRLDEEVQAILGTGQSITSDQRTKIEVRLDRAGAVKAIRIVSSSGFRELDRAATQAFYLAAPFPNPPTGMMGENEEVSLSWDFVVVAQQSSGIRVDVRRSGF